MTSDTFTKIEVMEKLELTKKYKTYYSAKTKPEMVELEEAHYICIQGKGDPSGQDFADNVQYLYAAAYALKFIYKEKGKDYVIPKLEGQWWYDEDFYGNFTITEAPVKVPREAWNYHLLLRLPEYVLKEDIELAKKNVKQKKRWDGVSAVGYFRIPRNKVVQILHVGPFDKEPASLALIKDFMLHMSLKRNGLHHEVYLSDFRKTTPEKLKTILREPVK